MKRLGETLLRKKQREEEEARKKFYDEAEKKPGEIAGAAVDAGEAAAKQDGKNSGSGGHVSGSGAGSNEGSNALQEASAGAATTNNEEGNVEDWQDGPFVVREYVEAEVLKSDEVLVVGQRPSYKSEQDSGSGPKIVLAKFVMKKNFSMLAAVEWIMRYLVKTRDDLKFLPLPSMIVQAGRDYHYDDYFGWSRNGPPVGSAKVPLKPDETEDDELPTLEVCLQRAPHVQHVELFVVWGQVAWESAATAREELSFEQLSAKIVADRSPEGSPGHTDRFGNSDYERSSNDIDPSLLMDDALMAALRERDQLESRAEQAKAVIDTNDGAENAKVVIQKSGLAETAAGAKEDESWYVPGMSQEGLQFRRRLAFWRTHLSPIMIETHNGSEDDGDHFGYNPDEAKITKKLADFRSELEKFEKNEDAEGIWRANELIRLTQACAQFRREMATSTPMIDFELREREIRPEKRNPDFEKLGFSTHDERKMLWCSMCAASKSSFTTQKQRVDRRKRDSDERALAWRHADGSALNPERQADIHARKLKKNLADDVPTPQPSATAVQLQNLGHSTMTTVFGLQNLAAEVPHVPTPGIAQDADFLEDDTVEASEAEDFARFDPDAEKVKEKFGRKFSSKILNSIQNCKIDSKS